MRRANAQWDQMFGKSEASIKEDDDDGTNIPEPTANVPAAADNEPATDTNVNIDLNTNNSDDGSIDDLLGDTNIADIDPPVDDQYSVDAGGESPEIREPENKNGKVIGTDNDDLIIQWEDGTTSTEKVNNVELS